MKIPVSLAVSVMFVAILSAEARMVPSPSPSMAGYKMLKEENNCWDSLTQINACTVEIFSFFVNGETYLSHGCCEAVSTITEKCWPGLMGALGFTTEEGYILEGYCDRVAANAPAPLSNNVDS